MNDDGLGIWNTIIKDQLLIRLGKIEFCRYLPTYPGEIHGMLLT
jgi:hypothetical protein